jgi:hypothetical protein
MLHIAEKSIEFFEADTSITPENLPHQSGDWIVYHVGQPSTTTQTASSGWSTPIAATAANNINSAIWVRKATSSSEPDPTFTGGNAAWDVQQFIIRGADGTDLFDVTPTRSSVAGSSTSSIGTQTTTTNNCLMINFTFTRQLDVFSPTNADMDKVTVLQKGSESRNLMTSYFVQRTAGATPNINFENGRSATQTVHHILCAIKPANPSTNQVMPEYRKKYKKILYMSGLPTSGTSLVALSRNESWTMQGLSAITPTTIDGLTVQGDAPTVGGATISESPDGLATTISQALASSDLTNGTWQGGSLALPSAEDLSDKIYSFLFGTNTTGATIIGNRGFAHYFEDSSNNWAVMQITPRGGISISANYITFVSLPDVELLDESASPIDWSDITRVGWMLHKVGTNTAARLLRIKSLVSYDKATVIGGGSNYKAIPIDFANSLNAFGTVGAVESIGGSVARMSVPYEIGDGSIPTTYSEDKQTIIYRLPPDGTPDRRWWRVPEDKILSRYNSSASDTFQITNGSTIFNNRQIIDFSTIDSDATVSTESRLYSEAKINSQGFVITGATLDECYQTDVTLGGGLHNCRVSRSLADAAVLTDDPSLIDDTGFISNGTGHAIEATDTGTFSFVGNTFTGYGADETTDAAFYNNSGGLITLEIPTGGQSPTIRNGAGASTVLDTPSTNQSVTLTNGVNGSRVQIYDLTADEELVNDIVTFPYTWTDPDVFANNREIRVRIAYNDGLDGKLFLEENIGTSTNATPALNFRVNQEDDVVYETNAINGSEVTGVTIDDDNLLIEVDTGQINFATIYAYEHYWLFTEEGIRDEGRAIVAIDTANYLVFNFLLKNVTDPTEPLVITGAYVRDGITGQAIDIIDTSGGTIFIAPDHVVAFAVGSGVTPGDISEIRAGLALESTSGEILSNTDATQAKVDQL